MIVNSFCKRCFQPYEILLEPQDLGLLKQITSKDGQKVKCPRLCGEEINIVQDPGIAALAKSKKLKDPLHLTGRQLYKACMGAGLPDELPKNAGVVRAVLKNCKIKDIYFDIVGDEIYIHEIVAESGCVVHLTAGARGAKVLKVTQPRKEKK